MWHGEPYQSNQTITQPASRTEAETRSAAPPPTPRPAVPRRLTRGAEDAEGEGLVEVEAVAVLLLEGHQLRQRAHVPEVLVEALHLVCGG